MRQNYHLLSNEQNGLQVSGYVQDYSTNALGMRLDEAPLPSDVSQVVSDFITDLWHYASMHGGNASEVLSQAIPKRLP